MLKIKKFKQKWNKLSFNQKSQLSIMLFIGVLAFLVAWKQAGISGRLLRLEEVDREPVLSIEIGSYTTSTYAGDNTKESLIINPVFTNNGKVPIKILGSGFHINEPDNFGRTFITYTRAQAGISVSPGGENTLRYEIRASEDRLSEYRFDMMYKKEPNGEEKCFSLVLFRGKEKFLQNSKYNIDCP